MPAKIVLSNARWESPQATYGESVTAIVELRLDPPGSTPPRLDFVFEALEPGRHSSTQTLNASAGIAKIRFTVPEVRGSDGEILPRCGFQFSVKAPGAAPVRSGNLEAAPGSAVSPFDSVIYYNPVRDEYLMCETEEEFKSLKTEVDILEAIRGKGAKAREKEDAARRKEMEALEKEARELFDGESVGDADGALEELLLVRRNPRWGKVGTSVFIRSHARGKSKVKWHTRKATDATLKKNLQELLKRAPGDKHVSPLLDRAVKASGSFLEENWSRQWPIKWHLKTEKSGTLAGRPYTVTKEAAVCRFVAGGSLDVDLDFKDRAITLGGSSKVSYALFEGRMEGTIPMPEAGINLLDYIAPIDYLKDFLKRGRECRIRLALVLTAQAFVGVTARVALSLPHIDLSKAKLKPVPGKKKPPAKGAQGKVGGSGEIFGGAKGEGGLAVAVQWSTTSATTSFIDLATGGFTAGASAGAGGKIEGLVEFEGGKFRFKLSAAACLGLGIKGEIAFDLDLDEGCALIGHLFHSVDYHFVGEVSLKAFQVFTNYGFTLMVEGEEVLTGAVKRSGELVEDFRGWLGEMSDDIVDVKNRLASSIRHRSCLHRISPEALAQVLETLMQTREESDFENIRLLLESTMPPKADVDKDPSANHKLKCALRLLSGVKIPKSGSERDLAKEKALEVGMERILNFGVGVGFKDAAGNKANPNSEFVQSMKSLFKRYKVKS